MTTISLMVIDSPLALVVTNTVVKKSGTVVKVLPAGLVVVKVIGPVRENGLLDKGVAGAVTPLEGSVTRKPG